MYYIKIDGLSNEEIKKVANSLFAQKNNFDTNSTSVNDSINISNNKQNVNTEIKETIEQNINSSLIQRTSKDNNKNNQRINKYFEENYPDYKIDFFNDKSTGYVTIKRVQTKAEYEKIENDIKQRDIANKSEKQKQQNFYKRYTTPSGQDYLINNTINAIKGVAKYEHLNHFQEQVLDMDLDRAVKIRTMFLSAISDIIKDNATNSNVNTAEFEEIVTDDFEEIKSSKTIINLNGVNLGNGILLDTDIFDNVKIRNWNERLQKYVYKDFILISNEADDVNDTITGRTPSVKIMCLKANGIDGTIDPYIMYEIRDLHDQEELNEITDRVIKIEKEGYTDSDRVIKDLFSTIR